MLKRNKGKLRVFLFHQEIADEIGQDQAIFLNQVQYWLSKCGRCIPHLTGQWFYSSLQQWHVQHFSHWSMYRLRKTISSLEESGLLLTSKVNSHHKNHTKWYSINEEKYNALVSSITNPSSPTPTKFAVTPSVHNNTLDQQQMCKMQLVAEAMIEAWNEESERYGHHIPAYCDTTIVERLYKLWQGIFKQDMQLWRAYYRLVTSSNFLMGGVSYFKATFSWLVKYETVLKITAGGYGVNISLNGAEVKATYRFVETQQINNSMKENKYPKRSSSTHIEKTKKTEELTLDTKKVENTQSDNNDTELLTSCEPSESTIPQQMVNIWNEEFRYSLSPIRSYSNAKIAKTLYDIYIRIFETNMEKWRQYARTVNSSKFLMGEKTTRQGFKALFSWLIRKEVIEEILGGGYGVGDRVIDRYRVSENIEQEKKAIIEKAVEQVSLVTKARVCEEEEFKRYVLEEGFEGDGNRYGIKSYIRGSWYISGERLIYDERNKGLYDILYETYVLKKQTGKNRLEMLKDLEEGLDAGIKKRGLGLETLDGLKKLKRSVMEGRIQDLGENINLLLSERTMEC
ncbi:hypothetical protein EDM53_01620 [Rickettsiales endosymbiont of Peranema trichophorum]|uniref:hypothetical protein n=1 Tax=Rickettsiales endosymbiont of Peranema trichophorum TaxID=2486577 RepID=UPI001022E85D|nr:hypothetical protein [Rickettsiales endosymbiont of Peranema trichophorum]RZI47507.1 hypothetical protein EDM53_01620 [Rickettsiales endosymbiont of Peranema trichophorum]